MWADPPENILTKVYVFNITNSEQFLNGTDNDLHLQEVGPIVHRQVIFILYLNGICIKFNSQIY